VVGYLYEMGVVTSTDTKAASLFEELFPNIFDVSAECPSEYVGHCWKVYLETGEVSNALSGYMFEYVLATALIRENLLPFYMQARAAFVPNVHYDILLYTPALGPIALSAKTSLRERYKQADLEAIALKYVHRRAQCHLVTLDEVEAHSVSAKIRSGDVIGLDSVVVAHKSEFDKLFENLQDFPFEEAPIVSVIEAQTVVTSERIGQYR